MAHIASWCAEGWVMEVIQPALDKILDVYAEEVKQYIEMRYTGGRYEHLQGI